jgi:hypothetical protein
MNWFHKFEVPESSVSGQGSQFTANVVKDFNRILHTKYHLVTAYSSLATGTVDMVYWMYYKITTLKESIINDHLDGSSISWILASNSEFLQRWHWLQVIQNWCQADSGDGQQKHCDLGLVMNEVLRHRLMTYMEVGILNPWNSFVHCIWLLFLHPSIARIKDSHKISRLLWH